MTALDDQASAVAVKPQVPYPVTADGSHQAISIPSILDTLTFVAARKENRARPDVLDIRTTTRSRSLAAPLRSTSCRMAVCEWDWASDGPRMKWTPPTPT
jgi:hypothetical protein